MPEFSRISGMYYPHIWLLCKLLIYGWVQDGMQVCHVLNFIKFSLSFDVRADFSKWGAKSMGRD
jgi:hypothetical protein